MLNIRAVITKVLLILMFFPLAALTIAQNISVSASVAFTIEEKDLVPEGITYDPGTHQFFVSSINKGKVITVNEQGNPLFTLPTTCVMAEDYLYCLANTSLIIFSQKKMNFENDLHNPVILKYKIIER